MSDDYLVLGVDPGLTITGYGLVLARGPRLAAVGYGALVPGPRASRPERLHHICGGLREVIGQWHPQVMALETVFVSENVRSAMAIGEARAAAMISAAEAKLEVLEYTPAQVKRAITTYGRSPKGQVQEMVRRLLTLSEPPEPRDASDALAVALCHHFLRERQTPEGRRG